MPRKATPRISRRVEPDRHLRSYEFRKRTAHHMMPNGENREDAFRHQTMATRTKRTSTATRGQLSPSKGSVKRRKVSSRQGSAQKNKNKEWLAEAILGENDKQYLIKYEPVHEGAEPEISWQPKRNANDTLVAWWKERKMASALQNSDAERHDNPAVTLEGNEASQRDDLARLGGRAKKPAANHRTQEQYGTKDEVLKQDSGAPGKRRLSDDFGKVFPNSRPNATNRAGAFAHHRVRLSGVQPAAAKDNDCQDKSRLLDDTATKAERGGPQPEPHKVAIESGQQLKSLTSSRQPPATDGDNFVYVLGADETRELRSSLVEAANVCVLGSPQVHDISTNAAYGVSISDRVRAEDLTQFPEGHVKNKHCQGVPSPRLGTSISTIQLPALSASGNNNNNNQDHRTSTFVGKDSGQTSPRTLAHVDMSNNRDAGIPGAPLGKLASAREQLRLLLRGPGRRRFRKSDPLLPPSP